MRASRPDPRMPSMRALRRVDCRCRLFCGADFSTTRKLDARPNLFLPTAENSGPTENQTRLRTLSFEFQGPNSKLKCSGGT